jgi:hypothetical protein
MRLARSAQIALFAFDEASNATGALSFADGGTIIVEGGPDRDRRRSSILLARQRRAGRW